MKKKRKKSKKLKRIWVCRTTLNKCEFADIFCECTKKDVDLDLKWLDYFCFLLLYN